MSVETLQARAQLRWIEALPWFLIAVSWFLFEDYRLLGSQILIAVLFALSLDLILGYAGIVTLGHSAFFGVGAYTAGILATHGWHEPLSALIAAGVVAGMVGAATGAVILRTHGLTLLMLTLAVVFMLHEVANKWTSLTGGADGLQGMKVDPIFGLWRFDFRGNTGFIYCAVVLLICWYAARRIIHSPFGRSLTGIRENVVRSHAIGTPVDRRLVTIFAISAGIAGIAGGLLAQTTKFVGLNAIAFERSGDVLIMLILGGVGRLYGAFVGAPIYMIAQDKLAKLDPVFWFFWIGLLLVLVVMFARGGILGIIDRVLAWLRARR
jgi:branched-chain amino acid transport system permease protein